MKKIIYLIAVLFFSTKVFSTIKPDTIIVYKKIDATELKLHVFYSKKQQNMQTPAGLVFFHGGGWNGGGVAQFYNQCAYFSERGLTTISVQYRTKQSSGTSPKECLKDAKSAMRWIKSHADELGLDAGRLIAGGGSAGGHLAAALATVEGFDEPTDDMRISCKPNALLLFNPVANNAEEGYGYSRVKTYWKEFSPYHNIKKNTAPTLIMLGSKDKLFPVNLAQKYKASMEAYGNRCDLIVYENQDHAFFNFNKSKEMHCKTIYDADIFLTSLGYLKGNPTIDTFKHKFE